MESVLLGVVLAYTAAYIGGRIAERLHVPRAAGQITAGVFLGLPLFAGILGNGQVISFLGELGIIFLLLLAGMEVNPKRFRGMKKEVIVVSILCVIVPFTLGAAATRMLGHSWLSAIIVGAALSLTAEGTTLEVLEELGLLKSKVGLVIFGAGILDDIFELLLLAGIVVLSQGGNIVELAGVPVKIMAFLVIAITAYHLYPRLMQNSRSEVANLSLLVLFTLITAILSEMLGTGYVLGAFIAGLIIRTSINKAPHHVELLRSLHIFTFAVIVPFFFIDIGRQFSVHQLTQHMPTIFLILTVAIIGKVGGALLAKPWTTLSYKQLFIVGWGMNSRGAVELVAATIALSAGLLTEELFAAIVVVSLVTTLAFPLVISRYKHWATDA